ncbi:Acid phosphatase-like protein 2 [Linnemannia hyalina]|uniref:Acid phosphatase-like protein 2 n=1 Tax=Linnemannia hyalina TaxID=64524 RepID=A0A9P7XIZ5_9FUNG|nr:Acid phosphatase-like protein 2 [Linnemannia hyalina]
MLQLIKRPPGNGIPRSAALRYHFIASVVLVGGLAVPFHGEGGTLGDTEAVMVKEANFAEAGEVVLGSGFKIPRHCEGVVLWDSGSGGRLGVPVDASYGDLCVWVSVSGVEKSLSSVSAIPTSTPGEKRAKDVLFYEDRRPYSYCEADHPTVDTYPDPPVEGATLSNVQMFIRHGDRTSQSFYPVDHEVTYECSSQINSKYFTTPTNSDTFNNASLITTQVVTIPQDSPFAKSIWRGSCIPGQLTPKGAGQQERMGRDLREVYVDRLGFLPEVFDQEKFFVRSTDVWRTRQSATSLMTGLYPTNSPNIPPPNFRLATLPFELEYLIFNERDQCPRITQLKSLIARSNPTLQHLYTHIPAPILAASQIIDYPNTLSLDDVSDFVSPRASNLLIELWETPSQEKYIRVLYNSRIVVAKSNWCDLSWCPAKTFLKHLDKFRPGEDYLEKCQEQPKRKPKNNNQAPYQSDVK